jgi:hypothetical protein
MTKTILVALVTLGLISLMTPAAFATGGVPAPKPAPSTPK